MLPHLIYILFLFALGACVGSFLNVVVWRLPRVEVPASDGTFKALRRTLNALTFPPSHCPKCNTPLAWYDNIPVFGWIALRGRCRYCKAPISPRYPIVEAVTGLLFVFYYVAFYIWQVGPCPPVATVIAYDSLGNPITLPTMLIFSQHWPIYSLYMILIACLLAASLIDAELFIIPIEVPWLAAIIGIAVHAIVDRPTLPGALSVGPFGGAVAAGGGVGLIVSLILYGRGVIPRSFPNGEPLLEVDRAALLVEIEVARREGKTLEYHGDIPPEYSRAQIRTEITKEMLFLLPPMLGALVVTSLIYLWPAFGRWWQSAVAHDWVGGMLGAILGALVGGFVVWMTRILGTIGFGRVAMGLGDAHLMFGVGAVIGAGAATVAFFLAPFCGIAFALYKLIFRKGRELPYGPFLAMATAVVMLFYCPIAAYLTPGLQGMMIVVRGMIGA